MMQPLIRTASWRSVAWLCAVLWLHAPYSNAQDAAQNGNSNRKRADEVLREIRSGELSKLLRRFTPKMQELLPEEKLKPTLGQLELIAGQFVSVGDIRAITQDGKTLDATALHEKRALIYRLTFDDENRLAGLYVRPAPLPKLTPEKNFRNDVFAESEVTLDRDDTTLFGTLCVPNSDTESARWPLVIFHSGSGPTDRNCNGPLTQTNATLKLAHALAARGIASLRYDKRGSGESALGVTETDLVPRLLVEDYKLWVQRYQSDARFSKLVLAGHSEGAQLAFRAAKDNENIASVIAIAGSGRSMDELLLAQLKSKISNELYSQLETILSQLRTGKPVPDVPPELASVVRPSVQNYLIDLITSPPASDVASLSVPVFILQGDRDIQISVADAKRLDQAARSSTLRIIEDMNHVLVEIDSPQAQLESYNDPDKAISKTLVEAIDTFVKDL